MSPAIPVPSQVLTVTRARNDAVFQCMLNSKLTRGQGLNPRYSLVGVLRWYEFRGLLHKNNLLRLLSLISSRAVGL